MRRRERLRRAEFYQDENGPKKEHYIDKRPDNWQLGA